MSALTVRPVQTAAEREAFLRLPDRLWGADPRYVPALRPWLRRRLAPTNPLFEKARLELLGAWRGEELVGRISVLEDRHHNADQGEAVGWFGFLVLPDDGAVAEALLGAAEARARAWGCAHLRGNRNLTRLEDPGVTVEGFDRLPPMLTAHHPPHVARLLEARGYEKHHDLLAYEIDLFQEDGSPRPLPDRLAAQAAGVDLPGLEVRAMSWAHLRRDLRQVYSVFDAAYRTVPDTAPMPYAQFVSLALPFLTLASRHLVQIATVQGRPAGFVLCLPELNEAFGALDGGLGPVRLARFARDYRRIRTAAFKLIGVLPEFRGTGLHARLIAATIDGVRRAGYARVDGSVIDERNGPMRAVVEGIGMRVYRRYRFYDRAL